jgi:hypothetical protein
MRKYILAIGVGALLYGSGCDSMNQENTVPVDLGQELLESGSTSEENLRIFRGFPKVEMAAAKNYRMMERAYSMLPSYLPLQTVERTFESSRSREQFIEKMIKASLEIFDNNIQRSGRFLSPLSRRNHQSLAADEHEVEYDILAGKFKDDDEALASLAGFIKIDDIKGESQDKKYPIFKFVGNSSTKPGDDCKGKGPWCDSIPPIKQPDMETLLDWLPVLASTQAQPAALAQQLDILSGELDQRIIIGLLLPAVQKQADVPQASEDSGHKDWINIESVGRSYGLELGKSAGTYMAFGAGGSIFGLLNEKYDASGDLDWATIQLNRRKFEFEMLYFLSSWWEAQHQEDPATGR